MLLMYDFQFGFRPDSFAFWGGMVRIFNTHTSRAFALSPGKLLAHVLNLQKERVPRKDIVVHSVETESFLGTRSFYRSNTCASSYPGLKAKALLV